MARKQRTPPVKAVSVRPSVRHYQLTEKACPVCRTTFLGTKKKTYCSRPCQNRADYGRHAEARREHRREYHRQQRAGEAP
jgi:hypothetical protein